jgi:hypothetical protein
MTTWRVVEEIRTGLMDESYMDVKRIKVAQDCVELLCLVV